MQYLDLHQWMPKDILLKADKMSMASSLELRVPLLDIEMQKLSQTIPTKYLINQNNTKDVFRQASNRHLPKEWANREKLGFPVPIKAWLKEGTGYEAVKSLLSQTLRQPSSIKQQFYKCLKTIAKENRIFSEKSGRSLRS